MAFDLEIHNVKQILIKCGRALREAKGLPSEKNISVLYREASEALGIPLIETTSVDADHLPAPHEMMSPDGNKFVVPRKDCPQCGGKETIVLGPLCASCADAKDEEGNIRYHTMWKCLSCDAKDRSEMFFSQWMTELGIEMPTGPKQALGIKTFTDAGMK
jgi:hypothetical protein